MDGSVRARIPSPVEKTQLEIAKSNCSVIVNGESRKVPSELSIDTLLTHLDHDPEMPGVAVAVNDAIVRKALWAETIVHEGDRVEIITASQGG